MNILNDTILNDIIIGYRQVISDRYQYNDLIAKYDLPETMTEEKVKRMHSYFLSYIYPPVEKRQELNEAFDSLDEHIKHPDQLLRIIIDSGSLIFKFGRYLPKILIAGLKALKSFRTASKFEGKLAVEAAKSGADAPFIAKDIKTFMSRLPKDELIKFMHDSEALFETLYDRKLVNRIVAVVTALIAKMKKRPNVYTEAEIKGLELGKDIIKIGNSLFEELSDEEQKLLFEIVIKIEREAIEEAFI